ESYSPAGYARIQALAQELAALRERSGQPLTELVADVERTVGVGVETQARRVMLGTGAGREHLDAFAEVVAGYAADPRASLGGLLAFLAAAESVENGLEPGEIEVAKDRVQVLTVHAAKGLEWEIVAVPHIVRGVFPSGAAAGTWLGALAELPTSLRGDRAAADAAEGVPVLDLSDLADRAELERAIADHKKALDRRRLDEERRLFYVALTRTERVLLVSAHHWAETGNEPKGPSDFLLELNNAVESPDSPAFAAARIARWDDPPEIDATNPFTDNPATAEWPRDPLGTRRDPVEQGAALVRAALADLRARPRSPRHAPKLPRPTDTSGACAHRPGVRGAPESRARATSPAADRLPGPGLRTTAAWPDDIPPPPDDGPPQDFAPPPDDYDLPPDDYDLPPGDYDLPPGDVAPYPDDLVPPTDGDVVPSGDMSLRPGDSASFPGDFVLPAGGYVTPPGGRAQSPGDSGSPRSDFPLPPPDLARSPDDLAPPPDDHPPAEDRVRPEYTATHPGDREPGPEAGEVRTEPPVDPDDPEGWAADVDALLAERDATLAAEREVELPGQIPATALVEMRADPSRLARRLRRPLPYPPNPLARRGTAFHAWVQRWFSGTRLLGLDELPGAGVPETGEGADAELARMQDAFLNSAWAHRSPIDVEVPFETSIAGVVIRGRMDAVFAEPGGRWVVVDWKTGAEPDAGDEAAVAMQLAIYRLAWARLMAARLGESENAVLERVGAAFHYVRTGRTIAPADLPGAGELAELISASAPPRTTGN
uniref:3'-5' exonuclease n=1 Tax=Nocardia higoensis TaxID=228599 RepID=UPI001FDF4366